MSLKSRSASARTEQREKLAESAGKAHSNKRKKVFLGGEEGIDPLGFERRRIVRAMMAIAIREKKECSREMAEAFAASFLELREHSRKVTGEFKCSEEKEADSRSRKALRLMAARRIKSTARKAVKRYTQSGIGAAEPSESMRHPL